MQLFTHRNKEDVVVKKWIKKRDNKMKKLMEIIYYIMVSIYILCRQVIVKDWQIVQHKTLWITNYSKAHAC